MSHTFEAMEEHKARFGLEASRELAEFSLNYIQRTADQLETLLLNGESKAAAKYAHKALGAVRLYGTPKLEMLLCRVRDNSYGPETRHNLQHELLDEFSQVDEALREWLAQVP